MGVLAYLAVLVGAFVAAATTGLPPWADYGVLGAMVLGFLSKQIVPGYLYRQQLDRADALESNVRLLTDKLLATNEAAIPALREATTAVLQATEEIRLIRARRR